MISVRARRAHRRTRVRAVGLVVLASMLVVSCSQAEDDRPTGSASPSAGPSATVGAPRSPSPARSPGRDARSTPSPASPGHPGTHPDRRARQILARLSLPEQVGQLLMVGIPAGGASPQLLDALGSQHVGNIFLMGRSAAGARSTSVVVGTAQKALSRETGVPLLVATDQEGGWVQVLTGPGFSSIPSAVVQGSWSPAQLRRSARRWARELRAAGVNLDLAPVGDVVPSAPDPDTNRPIGHFDRQFGATASAVRAHALPFVRGMSDVHVGTAVKHFPGLGHVRDNTDTSSSVVDDAVGPNDPGLDVFRDAARAGTTMVMASTATYRKLDASLPAAFSPLVLERLLRGRLGFSGVVVSDDLGTARQVSRWPPGRRAAMFVSAGGDLALTVQPDDAPAMAGDLLAAARHSKDMRLHIRRAALRVLVFKARLGLLAGR